MLSDCPLFSWHFAHAFIGTGLIGVCGHLLNPSYPIATAVAVIALGTTIITLRQFPSGALLYLHLAIYASLYLLVVGALGDLVSRTSATGFTLAQSADLGASAAIMLFVAKLCLNSERSETTK